MDPHGDERFGESIARCRGGTSLGEYERDGGTRRVVFQRVWKRLILKGIESSIFRSVEVVDCAGFAEGVKFEEGGT
jgi:hypothetical protein